jgi:hypothetical protein
VGDGPGLLRDVILTASWKDWIKAWWLSSGLVLCRNMSTGTFVLHIASGFWSWNVIGYPQQPIYAVWPFTSRRQVTSITSRVNLVCHGSHEKLIIPQLVRILPAISKTWSGSQQYSGPPSSVPLRIMQNTVVWDVTSCSLRPNCCFHLHGRRIS